MSAHREITRGALAAHCAEVADLIDGGSDVVPFLVSAVFCGSALVAVRRARNRTTTPLAQSDLAR